jgi:hypothetical protein
MICLHINNRFKQLKTIFNMKYIIALVLILIIAILCIPIMIITWNMDGFGNIVEGIEELCGIE